MYISPDGSLALGFGERGGPIKLKLMVAKPGWFTVIMGGHPLVGPTPWPWFDACLALRRMGKHGDVELYDYVRPYPLKSGNIEETFRERYAPETCGRGINMLLGTKNRYPTRLRVAA